MSRDRPELRALTGLRFLAAMHVLVFHGLFTFSRASTVMRVTQAGPVRAFLSTGYVSVNLFFVLSGFVLAYAYVDDGDMTTSAGSFWRARFARVYPMHVVGVLLALPLFVLGSEANRAPGAVVAAEAAKELGLSLSLVQAWVPAHALDLNGPAWSLSAEAFFYLTFPLLVRLLGKMRTAGLAVAGVIAWGCALAPPLVHGGPASVLARTTEADMVLLYDPLVRLPDFVVGVVAGLAFVKTERRWTRAPWVAAATSLVIVVLLAESEGRVPFALLHDGLLDPLWALLIFALAMAGDAKRGSGTRPLVWGGRASYSLYVIHKPLYFWLARAFRATLVPSSAFLSGYVALSIAASLVAWRWVEEPLRGALAGDTTRK